MDNEFNNIKDMTRVLRRYDALLAQANRELILLGAQKEELIEEIKDLRKKLEDTEKVAEEGNMVGQDSE